MAENTLVDKILALQDKYNSLQAQLSDPAVIADMKKYVQLNKDYKQLEPIVKTGLDYKRKVEELAEAKGSSSTAKPRSLLEECSQAVKISDSPKAAAPAALMKAIFLGTSNTAHLPIIKILIQKNI